MELKEIITIIATERIRRKPEFLLRGSFAFSHRGEFESPTPPAPASPIVFIPQTQVGYLTFDGAGRVGGEITVNRNGGTSELTKPNGTYALNVSNNIVTGTIETTSVFNPTTNIVVGYFFVVADNGKELKYAVQYANVTDQNGAIVRQPKVLVWGTMRKIYL